MDKRLMLFLAEEVAASESKYRVGARHAMLNYTYSART
jgi:hypothetical protein